MSDLQAIGNYVPLRIAAQIAQMPYHTLRSAVHTKSLLTRKKGGRRYVNLSELFRWVNDPSAHQVGRKNKSLTTPE